MTRVACCADKSCDTATFWHRLFVPDTLLLTSDSRNSVEISLLSSGAANTVRIKLNQKITIPDKNVHGGPFTVFRWVRQHDLLWSILHLLPKAVWNNEVFRLTWRRGKKRLLSKTDYPLRFSNANLTLYFFHWSARPKSDNPRGRTHCFGPYLDPPTETPSQEEV